MSSAVLDASALLALFNQEPGSELVEGAIAGGATISAVNLSEVVGKLVDAGLPKDVIRETLDPLALQVVSFDEESAYQAGFLRGHTRAAGLSLGDRACLALAQHMGLPVLTADRGWSVLPLEVTVRLVR